MEPTNTPRHVDRRPLNERYALPRRMGMQTRGGMDDVELPLRLIVNAVRSTLTIRCEGVVDGRACEYERGITFGPELASEHTIAAVVVESVQHASRMHPE